jgi:hypothetical protein
MLAISLLFMAKYTLRRRSPMNFKSHNTMRRNLQIVTICGDRRAWLFPAYSR